MARIDGFDELPKTAKEGGLKKAVDDLFKQKNIILTSRPIGNVNFFHSDLTLQIIGFTSKNIKK